MAINVIVPMVGGSLYESNDSFKYPKIFTEIGEKTLIEYAFSPINKVAEVGKIVVLVPSEEEKKHSLSSALRLCTDKELNVVDVGGETSGAACTCLLAIENIDLEEPLIISSADHFIDYDLSKALRMFEVAQVDAGVITFRSIHPKWSYVDIEDNQVVRAEEKKVISDTAIAGFYYFSTAKLFFDATMDCISKDVSVNGQYFVAPTLNEIVLKGGVVKNYNIDKDCYYNFYDMHVVEEFDRKYSSRKRMLDVTESYIEGFNKGDIRALKAHFDEHAMLVDPSVSIKGRESIIDYIETLHGESEGEITFVGDEIFVDGATTIIHFELSIRGKVYKGVDVLKWTQDLKIKSLTAYLNEGVSGEI